MNRQLAIPLFLSFFLVCWIVPVEAQDTQDTNVNGPVAALPVMPMAVTFRTVPLYFRESLAEDSPYSGIEALADTQQSEPWTEIVLTERASGARVHYCNLQRSVDSMTERGEEAYFVPIEFHSEQGANATRVFTFRFADNAGETIEWRIVLDSAPPGAGSKAGVIPQAENRANTEILYATDVILAEIQPGTEIWNVESSPTQLQNQARWVLRSSGGRKRLLTIEQASSDEILIKQEDTGFPDAASAQLEVRRTEDGLALHAVTFTSHGHEFRISFEPGLSLPAPLTTDASDAKFSMDEDEHKKAASGRASVARGVEAEHVTWRLDAPDWAKAQTFETGVNVIAFGSVQ